MTDNIIPIDRPNYDKIEKYMLDLHAKWSDTIVATTENRFTLAAVEQFRPDYVNDLLEGVMQTVTELLKAGVKHPTEGVGLSESLELLAGMLNRQYQAAAKKPQNAA